MIVVRKTSGDVSGSMGAHGSDIRIIQSLVQEISTIVNVLAERANTTERHLQLLRTATDHLWLAPDEALAAQQMLRPRAERQLEDILSLRRKALALQVALQEEKDTTNIDNDIRLSLLEELWDENDVDNAYFSDAELAMSMREAKSKFDLEMFRKWKRIKKKLAKE
jgi:hypothetical protein